MRRSWAILAPAMLASCAHEPDGFSQADADAIVAKCNAPQGVLWVEDGGAVRFEPPLDMDYDASVCLLDEIKDAGVTKFGFVGNEKAPEPEGE